MDRKLAITKVKAYAKRPDIIAQPSMTEMADLVVLVLTAVEQIEQAIKAGRLDGYTPKPDKDYLSKETATVYLTDAVQKMLSKTDAVLSETSTELEKRVQLAINNIRNGEDGIVSDEEIERAAVIAASLIQLPDFDSIVTAAIQGNGALMRDALESLPEGDEQLSIEAIQGLVPKLKALNDRIDSMVVRSGGTIGKNQVYNFIAEAVADGTIPSGSSLPDQTGNSGKFLTTNGTTTSWATPAGSGDVIKVGTPVNNQIGVWTGDGTLEGDADLTFDTATNTLTTGIVVVSDDAYDATSWNGSTAVPTKNAIRDKIESLSVGSGISRTVTVTSGSATAGSTAATDYVYMIAGAHTMSLPAASGNTNRYTFKNNHSANVTIDTVGVETIEGAASISLAPEEAVDIISDGTNFRII